MAKGDRVVVGNGYFWSEGDNEKTMAYMPKYDAQGGMTQTPDGGVVVEAVGGIVVGSTGYIDGPIINVHRSYIYEIEHRAIAAGGKDFAQLIPIFLDRYQRVGFFPVEHVRIFHG